MTRLTIAQRAALTIARMDEPDSAPRPEPLAATTRGVLGRLEKTLGTGNRIEYIELDPHRVRVWHLQGRLQDSLGPAQVEDIVESIREHGQLTPAIVRPVTDDPKFSHEVIDGSRRRLACEISGVQLKAFSRLMNDREAAMVAQTSDDTVRHSAYEVGVRWNGWLATGIVTTSSELAELIKVSKSHISQQLNVALVPRPFLQLWGEHNRVPKAIYMRLATLIAKAKQANLLPKIQEALLAVAQKLPEPVAPNDASKALAEVELEFRPKRVISAPIERKGTNDRRLLTVHRGRQQFGIHVTKALSTEKQVAFAQALADFSAQWLTASE